MADTKAHTTGTGARILGLPEAICPSEIADITDLLEWRHKARGHKTALPWASASSRENLRRFTRKEKQAMLLGFLLSDGIRDEQLDAMIEAIIGVGGGTRDRG
jgi:hypothetical protein